MSAFRIEERQLPSYAGAWFDAPTLALHVAVISDADVEVVEKLGATPVRVAHSLAELEPAREVIARLIRWEGNYSAYVTQKELALLKQQQDFVAQQKEIADIEARRQAALLTDGAVPTPASEKPE